MLLTLFVIIMVYYSFVTFNCQDKNDLGSLTPELPESPEWALFFAQILKLHIAYMRIYGV